MCYFCLSNPALFSPPKGLRQWNIPHSPYAWHIVKFDWYLLLTNISAGLPSTGELSQQRILHREDCRACPEMQALLATVLKGMCGAEGLLRTLKDEQWQSWRGQSRNRGQRLAAAVLGLVAPCWDTQLHRSSFIICEMGIRPLHCRAEWDYIQS